MSDQKQNMIEQLNSRARLYQDAGMDRFGAIAQAAADFNLSVLVEGDDCRVYEAPNGIFVNCWLDENVSNWGKANPSTDNSIQWYTSAVVSG